METFLYNLNQTIIQNNPETQRKLEKAYHHEVERLKRMESLITAASAPDKLQDNIDHNLELFKQDYIKKYSKKPSTRAPMSEEHKNLMMEKRKQRSEAIKSGLLEPKPKAQKKENKNDIKIVFLTD